MRVTTWKVLLRGSLLTSLAHGFILGGNLPGLSSHRRLDVANRGTYLRAQDCHFPLDLGHHTTPKPTSSSKAMPAVVNPSQLAMAYLT